MHRAHQDAAKTLTELLEAVEEHFMYVKHSRDICAKAKRKTDCYREYMSDIHERALELAKKLEQAEIRARDVLGQLLPPIATTAPSPEFAASCAAAGHKWREEGFSESKKQGTKSKGEPKGAKLKKKSSQAKSQAKAEQEAEQEAAEAEAEQEAAEAEADQEAAEAEIPDTPDKIPDTPDAPDAPDRAKLCGRRAGVC
jgi:hypothetical protein